MKQTHSGKRVLVLGIGNTLLQDDGVGIHVTALLRENNTPQTNVAYVDGGTIGLSLLPGLEDADALIIVDAAELHAPPGTVRVFHGAEIEQQLSSRKCSVHEVAISDLLCAAALRGTCPAELALVAIQPCSTDLGLEPTAAIKAAIPAACAAVNQLTRGYQDEA